MRIFIFRVGRFVVQLAYQLLYEVVEGDNAHHTAILVQNYRKGVAGILHIPEKHVRFDGFRHEVGGVHRFFKHLFFGSVGYAEVVLGVEYAYHVIR